MSTEISLNTRENLSVEIGHNAYFNIRCIDKEYDSITVKVLKFSTLYI